MHRVFLALGSNVGDRKGFLEKALEYLSSEIQDVQCAPIYESKAVGYENQDDFLNMVCTGFTDKEPLELLKFVKEGERKLGRTETFRWGPREIDIDILLYGDLVLEYEKLTLPHPRMHERMFVLKPLTDLDPKILHPVLQKTLSELLSEFPESEKKSIWKFKV